MSAKSLLAGIAATASLLMSLILLWLASNDNATPQLPLSKPRAFPSQQNGKHGQENSERAWLSTPWPAAEYPEPGDSSTAPPGAPAEYGQSMQAIKLEPDDIHPNVEKGPHGRLLFTGSVAPTARGTIPGVIVGEDGLPVTSIFVGLRYVHPFPPPRSLFVAGCRTDDAGSFVFKNVIFGRIEHWSGGTSEIAYRISVEAPGYEWFDSSEITSHQSAVSITLGRECVLSGLVMSESDSKPVPFAWITVGRPAASGVKWLPGQHSGEDGRFTICGLGPGEWRIRVASDVGDLRVLNPPRVCLSRGSQEWVIVRVE